MSENDLRLALEGGVYRKGVYLKGVAPLLSREVKRLQAEVERLTRERDTALAEVERLKGLTWCAYCGAEFPLDGVTNEQIEQHIMSCESHPIRQYRMELDRLQAEVKQRNEQVADLESRIRAFARMTRR